MTDNTSKRKHNLKPFLPLVYALVLLVGIQFGLMLAPKTVYQEKINQGTNFQKLKDILHFVEENYVDSINKEKLMDDIIADILTELDPHSFYIPPKKLENVRENLQGNFEGIGIEFFIVDDTITVVSPISGGPSEQLGIISGDKIIYIEDSLVAGVEVTNDMVVKKLRGEKGSKVNIRIKRFNKDELVSYTIVRDKIPLYSLDASYMMDRKTGYIKINRFSATTYKEFTESIKELKRIGMANLILDLRQNPGGYLSAATEIVDELLEGRKLVVYTEGKASSRKEYVTNKSGIFEDGLLYILIDEGSASASEIVAGAIQDWDRGKIVGRRSFGKGLVQEQYNLDDGSALRLTVARYYTPSGRSIQKPYDGGSDKYYNELVERIDNGELFTRDSIKEDRSIIYYTADGRKVFGGGGISPDIFVAMDTTSNHKLLGSIRVSIPEFIYKHYSLHKDRYENFDDVSEYIRNFEISDELYSEFLDHFYSINPEVNKNNVGELRNESKLYLKAYLAKQMWSHDGYYPVINQLDQVIKAAYSEIQSHSIGS